MMKVYTSVADMREARSQLGRPGALDEVLVATGIDALFVLLDGGTVEIEGTQYRLTTIDGGQE